MDKQGGAGGTNRGAEQSYLNVRGICIAGVLTAMTVVMTVFTRIPAAYGYFNLGDTVILLAGAAYGRYTGAFAGAVGSALADIFTGAYIFAPISFIVKGVEGYAAGRIASGKRAIVAPSNAGRGARLTVSLAVGACAMVAGYFLAEASVLSLFDSAFGLSAAIAELPVNVVQGAVSAVLARVAVEGLKRTKII